MKIFWRSGTLLLLSCAAVACTRPMVTGRDVAMEPVVGNFHAPTGAVFEAAEQALRNMEYKVEYADRDQGALRTGWMPTTADSHYIELFGREDYGVTNSYYHLAVRVREAGEETTVEVSAPLRTMIAKMHSSQRQEKKFLSKVRDLLRSAEIKVTNVGVLNE